MTIIVIGISFALIWLGTTFFIFRYIIKLKNDLLNKHSVTENQLEKSEDTPAEKPYKPFENIKNVHPSYLLNFIQQEHPQVIALVLAHMEPNKASIILQNLHHQMQSEVSRRIATMDRVSHDITREIERVMEMKLSSSSDEDYTCAGGVESVVEILNNVDRASERQILDDLGDEDPELTEEIKKRMFGFKDIVIVDDRAIQKVIRKIDSKELAKALKTADPEVQNKIFKNMSKRAVITLKLDMEYMGPLHLSEVEEAQQKILSIIKYLEDKGEIKITCGYDI